MSDFNVQIKVRNARLLRAIRGVADSAAEFSRLSGVSKQSLSGLLTMRLAPLRSDGEWTENAYKICAYLMVSPEDIWPTHMQRFQMKKAEAEVEMSVADLVAITNGSDDALEQRQLLASWVGRLSTRQIDIMCRRNNGETFEQIASDYGVTKERIRQMELNAHRKMRTAAIRAGYRSLEQVLS